MSFIIKPKVLATLSLSVIATMGHSEVYKSVTPDGRIVYTDNADAAFAASQDASKILVMDKLDSLKPVTTTTTTATTITTTTPDTVNTTTTANTTVVTTTPPLTNAPPLTPQSVPASTAPATDSQAIPQTTSQTPMSVTNVKASKAGDYRLSIESPTVDMAYRKPAQPIDIQVKLSPALRKGDRLVYLINGKHIATTADTHYQVSTQDYLPNQYTLTVNVENIVGEVIASQSRSFYILQNNFVLQKQRKAAAEAKAAYDKLPWYKKIKININL